MSAIGIIYSLRSDRSFPDLGTLHGPPLPWGRTQDRTGGWALAMSPSCPAQPLPLTPELLPSPSCDRFFLFPLLFVSTQCIWETTTTTTKLQMGVLVNAQAVKANVFKSLLYQKALIFYFWLDGRWGLKKEKK